MKVDISEILDSPPKKRVLVLINHQAEISLGFKGFLSEQEISSLVASFQTDKELKVYSKYREIFKKAQHFLTSINQIHLMYKEEAQKLDKLMIVDMVIKDAEAGKTSRLLKEIMCNKSLGNLIPGYQEILRRRQINLKSAIQAFKDALKEHSFKVKAFEKMISSLEEQQDKTHRKNFLDSFLIEEIDYKSVKVDFEQYKKFREAHL